MSTTRDGSSWQDRDATPARLPPEQELLSPSTQIVTDREAYLGQGRHDVGRRIADDEVELFITADVASSLQREFVQHSSEFIALHDLGTSASLHLLNNLATSAGTRMQRLSVRRQGHGVALAVLQFMEMPLGDGTPLRVYSTDVNADAQNRAQVARALLAHSRLGVLLVGEMPRHTLAGHLGPLHEAMLRSATWPNRELLMVPLASSIALAVHAATLAQGSPVSVQVTPQADRPRQAWSFIGGAWNRMSAGAGGAARTLAGEAQAAVVQAGVVQAGVVQAAAAPPAPTPRPSFAEAPTQPMGLHPAAPPAPTPPMPTPALPMPRAGATAWRPYAERCMAVKGAVACCVFDTHTLQALAYAGGPPQAERLAQQGAALLSQMSASSRALGLGAAQADASISTSRHHLLLRHVAGHPGVAVHLVVAAATGNATLARMQLDRVEPPR